VQVGQPGQHEQQIREPVEIGNRLVRDLLRAREAHQPPFGAPADRAGQMQGRAARGAAREDEGRERGEPVLAAVDVGLEGRDLLGPGGEVSGRVLDEPRYLDAAVRLLARDGVLLFSNNLRGFRLDEALTARYEVKDISRETIPKDFERNPKIHRCWEVRRR